ncbi:MAG: SGNH/GDSL hydrolase family protein [Lacipirellulaceae bacterium]
MKTYASAFSFVAAYCLAFCANTFAEETSAPCSVEWTGRRVVFLGDSITNDGTYIAHLETALRIADPDAEVDFINLGLSSETVSGLSEPAHAFPRPDLHERLDRVLEKAEPKLVVACYGINDAIYYPFSKQRFTAYNDGVKRLIKKCDEAKVKLVLLTPLPFDPLPGKKAGTLLPAGEKEYSWKNIYKNYDEVMQKYAAWLVELREPTVTDQAKLVACVIDLHTPVNNFLQEKRQELPDYSLSKDGVHINSDGHQLMAQIIARATGIEPRGVSPRVAERKAEIYELVKQRQDLLHDAWLSHVGHKRPGVKPGLDLKIANNMADNLLKMIKLVQ